MKKLLLFILTIAITVSTIAQNKIAIRKNVVYQKKEISKNVKAFEVPYTPLLLKSHGAKKKAVNSVEVGTSVNLFGSVLTETNCLDYDPATNTVMFTHRAGGARGGDGADIRCTYSTDWFATMQDSVVFENDGTHLHCYPSGVIYNPAGNTDFHNSFSVICGPVTGSTNWTDSYFHSQKLDNTLLSNFYHPLVAPETGLEIINLSGGNGNLYILSHDDDGTNYLPYVKVRNGIFNSTTNAFDWSLTPTQITKLWGKRKFNGVPVDANFAWNQAWDPNGIYGYVFCTGIDSLMKYYNGTQLPQIFITNDGGLTYQYIAPFACWGHLTNLTDSIWPTALSIVQFTAGMGPLEYRPFFNAGSTLDDNTLPGVVDANGDLHMAAIIEGYYSTHLDSLDYTYSSHPQFLFDVIYDASNGMWDVRFIDRIYSTVVEDASSAAFTTSPPPNIGYEHFINVSRSADGTVIFYTWTDTDSSLSTENISPYIRGRAWNIVTNTATQTKNFVDPQDGGLYFYLNTADIVKKQGTTYSIPMTYIDVVGDASSNADVAQVEYFITDATFNEDEFTENFPPSWWFELCLCWMGCDGVKNNEFDKFSVSQNYPNPAKETTSVKVTFTESSNVTVDITNMVGQTVSVMNKGHLASGTYDINLNVASLKSGIYFYTVTVGTQKVTKKMIVE